MLADDPGAEVGASGGSDAVARLRDLWRDETVADVLYPTAGLSILQGEDEELQEACCRAYNDWLIELCAVDPVRLLGLAMIATNDMDAAVAELERTRAAGLRGAIIWTAPPEGDSFFDPEYEPLWAAAAALAMPISLHILAGRRANIRSYGRDVARHLLRGVRVAARSCTGRPASSSRPGCSSGTPTCTSSPLRAASSTPPISNGGWTRATGASGTSSAS